MKEAHLYCYGKISDSEGGVTPEKVLAQLRMLSPDVTDIIVHINSYGGSVYAGFNVHEQLRATGKRITTITEGVCASIATVIFLAGDVRKITENSRMMIHAPMIGFSEDESLTASELELFKNDLQAEQDRIADFYANKTGLEIERVNVLMEKDTWISPDEAVEMKLATEKTIALRAVATLTVRNINTTEIMKSIDQRIAKIEADNKSWLEKIGEKISNALKGIKADGDPSPGAETQSYPLTDGNILYCDTPLAVGSGCFSDEGLTTPMPDGTYELTDGSTCVVKDGKCESVTPAPDMTIEEQLKSAQLEIETLKAERDAIASANNQIKEEAGKSIDNLTSRLSKIVSSGYKPEEQQQRFRKQQVDPPRKSTEEKTKEGLAMLDKIEGK